MKLIDRFNLRDKDIISLVGGGGKTTTMYKLSEELKNEGYRVLMTTTTAILNPEFDKFKPDYFFVGGIDESFIAEKGSITVYGDYAIGKKLKGGNIDNLNKLIDRNLFDYVIIEADGANRLPIKAPKEGEPVIGPLNTKTIGLIGLDSLGKRIKDIVHRPEYFEKIVGLDRMEESLAVEDVVKLIVADKGLFKESIGEQIVVLNKADTEDRIEKGQSIVNKIRELNFSGDILLGDIMTKSFY